MTDTTELRAAIRVWADSDEIYGRLARAEALRKAADRIEALSARVRELEEALENPPKHKFWGAGEPDCPREIKAGNGELWKLRCKVCGQDNPPSNSICKGGL